MTLSVLVNLVMLMRSMILHRWEKKLFILNAKYLRILDLLWINVMINIGFIVTVIIQTEREKSIDSGVIAPRIERLFNK